MGSEGTTATSLPHEAGRSTWLAAACHVHRATGLPGTASDIHVARVACTLLLASIFFFSPFELDPFFALGSWPSSRESSSDQSVHMTPPPWLVSHARSTSSLPDQTRPDQRIRHLTSEVRGMVARQGQDRAGHLYSLEPKKSCVQL